ncbi:LOW QUALITY PROTEIN: hypothetical protein ACHAW6_004383 [Cyclotella cf. meneghiniana]
MSPVSAAPSTATALQSSATSLKGADAIQPASKMKKVVSLQQKYKCQRVGKICLANCPQMQSPKSSKRNRPQHNHGHKPKRTAVCNGSMISSHPIHHSHAAGQRGNNRDSLLIQNSGTAVASATTYSLAPSPFFVALAEQLCNSLPILLLLSCRLCRSLSSFFHETTTAIFAYVAQSAIQSRGSRSISFALNAMVFNMLPTLLGGGCRGGSHVSKVWRLAFRYVLLIIFLYLAFTIFITK